MIKNAYYTFTDCSVHFELKNGNVITKNIGKLWAVTISELIKNDMNSDFRCNKKVVELLNDEFYPSEFKIALKSLINKLFSWIKK